MYLGSLTVPSGWHLASIPHEFMGIPLYIERIASIIDISRDDICSNLVASEPLNSLKCDMLKTN
jgi:hypothetical protein